MAQVIRTFLLAEAVTFGVAAIVHGGWLMSGYAHREARVAESIIAAVLFAGAALTWLRPMWARPAGLLAQGVALLLTLVGITMIAVGVGPQTPLDIVYHIAIVAVLLWGLVVTWRAGVRVP